MSTQYTSSGLKDHLLKLRANPGRVQQHMLRLLERMNNDEIIILDATNPAIFCLESAAVMSCANITDSESKLRRLYADMANTPEELYLHMADKDYLGVYSTPSLSNITLMFDLDELLQKAVPETSITGTKKITIPRYTKVTVADVDMTLLYPIDIRVMPHGGFNITFDTTEITPIGRVETNLLDWFIETLDGNKYLNITAPFHQLNIERFPASVNAVSGFTREYSFSGLYFYTRAYIQNALGAWMEIKTTMTDLVYNKEIPTLVLKVLNNAIKVTIPQIYLNNGLIKDTVRIDIYTTKGPLNINLQNYVPRSYMHDWSPLDNNLDDRFSAPLKTLSTVAVYSSDTINGGSRGMTFSELKNIVTSRSTVTEGLPINEKQLNKSVEDLGYKIVKNIDNITDRQFLATRALPVPENNFIVTNMGLNIAMLETTFLSLKERDTVTSSTYRLTIKPQTLYRLNSGVLEVLDSSETNSLMELQRSKPTVLVDKLNEDTFLYSPYYYVFDIKSTEILPRIYDMDKPTIRSRYFFQDNPSVGIRLGVDSYIIANNRTKDGYTLEIKLSIGDVIKALGPDYINVQLSYVGRDEPTRYYIDGFLVSNLNPDTGKPYGDDYIYQFKIETQYDIDNQDGLIPIPYRSPINLTHEFDIVTTVRDYNPDNTVVGSDVDNIVSAENFHNYNPQSTYIGVSQSKVTIRFGQRLEKLWTKTRTVVDRRQLQSYDSNVPARYLEDVYELDASGTIKLSYDSVNNVVTRNKIHVKGELRYDVTGEQIFAHQKGDPVLTEDGEPIYKNGGDGLSRQIDLFLVDALYYFANTNNVDEYRNSCTSLITQWITRDMDIIANQLLDRSEIFYYPPISIGQIEVNVDDDKTVKIDPKQSIHVKVYLTQINYRNASLRESLSKTITITVHEALSRKTVSVDAILQRLRAVTGNNVISFEVKGFLNDNYRTASLTNDTMSLALGKRAVVLPNLTIDIKDDIVIDFYPHGED